jgi:hypothetical protein
MTLYISMQPAGQVIVEPKLVQLPLEVTEMPVAQGIVESERELVLGTKLSARKAVSLVHADG